MITPEYCQCMARYNTWQNKSLRSILQAMSDAELDRGRGAFFGTIRKTANHLLWADTVWLARFEGVAIPPGGIAESTEFTPSATTWATERFRIDGRISLWADGLHAVDLVGDLRWFSGAAGRDVTRPYAVCVAHFFNHQAHHRGQLHAMLTAAGHEPGDTDLFLMPDPD